ncbi:MAG: iron-sulfur cluster repair di-iron protein [Acidobacteriota bacterium]|nr:iron-sulfur cluster repair di-iron protein [Acidobacteriota bacterium]
MTTFAEKTVREIALEEPSSVRVFESLGIDYCCGGKRHLSDACAEAQVDLANAVELLESAKRNEQALRTEKWSEQPLSKLSAFIVGTHHEYVRRETPRIEGLFAKVLARHGQAHSEIARMEHIFAAMSQELATHMLKEERVLFPYIETMEKAAESGTKAPAPFFGTVQRPIATMIAEHEDAGALLTQLRFLSNDFAPPAGACPTFIGLYRALEDFERDLHRHVHLENNILFPRALALENAA